jgi:hypothetical protein
MNYTLKQPDLNLAMEITTSDAKTLIRELCFQYDLKVLCSIKRVGAVGDKAFLLVRDGWCPIGEVFTKIQRDDDGKEYVEYCFYTHFYEKARGRSTDDRHTLHSKKASTLISTIKKVKAIPDSKVTTGMHMARWSDNVRMYENNLGIRRKDADEFKANELQVMMEYVLGESPNTNMTTEIQNKCKLVLDKYKEVDKMNAHTRDEVDRVFGKPFYAVGVNCIDQIVVGVVKCINTTLAMHQGRHDFEIITPFKTVDNLEEFPELVAVTTMWKAQRNDEGKKIIGGFLPVVSDVNKELDIVVDYEYGISSYRFVWMTTPCSPLN